MRICHIYGQYMGRNFPGSESEDDASSEEEDEDDESSEDEKPARGKGSTRVMLFNIKRGAELLCEYIRSYMQLLHVSRSEP